MALYGLVFYGATFYGEGSADGFSSKKRKSKVISGPKILEVSSEEKERIFKSLLVKKSEDEGKELFCPRCGELIDPSDKVCPYCSYLLNRPDLELKENTNRDPVKVYSPARKVRH